MSTIKDIKLKIQEIKNSDFKIEDFNYYDGIHKRSTLLRKALICVNSIGSLDNISKEEKKELYKELDKVMKNKLKKISSSFNDEVLNNMINSYYRGYIIYPMDIFVIDDAVFQKEGIYDDFGFIYKIETFMFRNMRPYYNAYDIDFTVSEFNFFNSSIKELKEPLTREDDMYISKFISDSINSIYNKNITRPTYELNTNTEHYGYSGITTGELYGVNCYINKNFIDIGRNIKKKEECDIKLCIQNKEDIILYYIHQSFKEEKPVWNVIKTNNKVWRLTEEVLKLMEEMDNKNKKDIKKLEKTNK